MAETPCDWRRRSTSSDPRLHQVTWVCTKYYPNSLITNTHSYAYEPSLILSFSPFDIHVKFLLSY